MIKSKKLWIACTISTLAIAVLAGFLNFSQNSEKITVSSMCSYTTEAADPKWLGKTSDLIIMGDIIKKSAPVIGKDAVNNRDAVYVDNHIRVTQIIKNTPTGTVKEGDSIIVRTLGGKTEKLDFQTDTEGLLPDNGKVLLCLVDVSKMPDTPPQSSVPCYALVGRVHGAFNMDTDGNAKRTVVKDSFKQEELIKSLLTK